jgi:hypothetical protein
MIYKTTRFIGDMSTQYVQAKAPTARDREADAGFRLSILVQVCLLDDSAKLSLKTSQLWLGLKNDQQSVELSG